MKTKFSTVLGGIKDRPWLSTLFFAAIFFLFHLINFWIYHSYHIAGLYLVGYVLLRDMLLGVSNSDWFASVEFALIIIALSFFVSRLQRSTGIHFAVAATTLIVVLALASVPLFTNRAFY